MRKAQRIGLTLLAVAVAVPLSAVLVAWSGLYNVASSAGHPLWLEHFLRLGMTRSVQLHSSGIELPDDLAQLDRIKVGAAHFEGGCAECHGAPGRSTNPVYAAMLPAPPDLSLSGAKWSAQELYWIVRHGLQYTGMPAWSGGERADEIWSVVSFLEAMPGMEPERYRALASGNAMLAPVPIDELAEQGTATFARAACDRCHDTDTAEPVSQLVPRLSGQSAAYLERSLLEYRQGIRRSGFMQPVAAMLSDTQVKALAAYYNQLPRSAANAEEPGSATPVSSAALEEAALIASGTHDELRIPACLSCHGPEARADYPTLAGQHAPYLKQQLQLWQRGGRSESTWGELMAVTVEALTEAQLDALAHWFAVRTPGSRGEEE